MTLAPTPAAASPFAAVAAGSPAAAATSKDPGGAASADRFLTLLVAQLKNQDPLNPMDNAQVTSQMAQINTVTGIEKLNATVASLSSQFAQSQAVQGASLIGRDVVVAGDRLAVDADRVGRGGFELAGAADHVDVEVLSGAGKVIDTLQLGALPSGLHRFDWPAGSAAETAGLRFRVVAKSGATNVAAATLMHDRVESVASGAGGLTLQLTRSGDVAYAAVKSIN